MLQLSSRSVDVLDIGVAADAVARSAFIDGLEFR